MIPVPDKEDDVVAWVTIRLHAHGAMSVSGTIADRAMARAMIDHAREALGPRIVGGIILPNKDVAVSANMPGMREMGDIPYAERGDS